MANQETISKLKKDIAAAKIAVAREWKREKLEFEEVRLKRELKELTLSRGQKKLRKNVGAILGGISKQARLIKEQQERDNARERSKGKEVVRTSSGVSLSRNSTKSKVPSQKRPVPKQLKKFQFKKKGSKAKKKKKSGRLVDDKFGLPSFDFQGI